MVEHIDDHNLLLRIDERTKALEKAFIRIEEKIEDGYVTKSEHKVLQERVNLISKIVFGFVGLVLMGVGSALVTLVIK